MHKYEPVNGFIIVIARNAEEVTKSGIILSAQSQKNNRNQFGEVIETNSELFVIGDKVICDVSSGSILEECDEGMVLAIPEDEVIAKILD